MGLILSGHSRGNGKWAVWEIRETDDELEALIPERIRKEDPLLNRNSLSKRTQRAAVRALLQELYPEGAPIRYDGKVPILNDGRTRISITHDPEIVGIQITPREKPAGIDIQRRRPKQLERVAERFLCPEELHRVKACPPSSRTELLNILWCAKEALYKACNTSLREGIHVEASHPAQEGELLARVTDPFGKRSDFELAYRRIGDHHTVHIADGDFI